MGVANRLLLMRFRGVLLELHLRMAVGALQERRIAVTGEICDRVFVHALMQKRRDEKVAEGVQVIGFRQTDLREQALSGAC